LNFDNDRDLERRRKSETSPEATSPRRAGKKKSGSSAEVGSALRSAYQRTVAEDIPPDLLDLLGKLG
jgi:hypothetical protein